MQLLNISTTGVRTCVYEGIYYRQFYQSLGFRIFSVFFSPYFFTAVVVRAAIAST